MNRKIRCLAGVLALLFASVLCNAEGLQVSAGLPPVGWILSQLGGDRVTVVTILPEGRTPHDYSPKPQLLRKLYRTKLFFSTGMPFEKHIEEAVRRSISVIDVGAKIQRRHLEHDNCESHAHHHHHHHEEAEGNEDEESDPHIWLSPANAIKIGETAVVELILHDPANADFYRQNFIRFRNRMERLDAGIRAELAPYAGRSFFVYHPSFGYFADAYHLHQLGIEMHGRKATVAQIVKLVRRARKEHISVIFIQPQFNPSSSEAIARRINGEVVALDPLTADLEASFFNISRALQAGFKKGGAQ